MLFGVDLAVSCAADFADSTAYAVSFAAVVLLGESSLFAVTAVYGVVLGSGGNPLDITNVVVFIGIGVFNSALFAESTGLAVCLTAGVLAAEVADLALAVECAAVCTFVVTYDTLTVVVTVCFIFNYYFAAAVVLAGVTVFGCGVNNLTNVIVTVIFVGFESAVFTNALFGTVAYEGVSALVSAVNAYVVLIPLVGEIVDYGLFTARICVGVSCCGSGPLTYEVVIAVLVLTDGTLTGHKVVLAGYLTKCTGSYEGIPYVALFCLVYSVTYDTRYLVCIVVVSSELGVIMSRGFNSYFMTTGVLFPVNISISGNPSILFDMYFLFTFNKKLINYSIIS